MSGKMRLATALCLLMPLCALLFLAIAWAAVTWAGEPDDTRRQQIESMTPEQKQQLLWLKERFAKLDPAEQQRLRQLHKQLCSEKNADQLRQVMHHYHEWLMTLSPLVRSELAEMAPEERIKRIKKIRADQLKSKRATLAGATPEDVEQLFQWMAEYARENADSFLDKLSAERRREILGMPETARRRMVAWLIWQGWQTAKPGSLPSPDTEELADLCERLSEGCRKHLQSKSPAEQRQIIVNWIRQAAHQQFTSRRFMGPTSPIDERKLDSFFETELTDQQRDRLLSLPGKEMQRELRKLYLIHIKVLGPPTRRSGGSGHGHRPHTYPTYRGPKSAQPKKARTDPPNKVSPKADNPLTNPPT